MHTPNGGFCEHLQSLDGGGPGGFDNVDVEPGQSVGPVEDAILLKAGEGERLETDHRVATIKIGREELSLIEFELKPSFEGPGVHDHDDHTDAFFVLDGEVGFTVDGQSFVAGAGTFVAAPDRRLPHLHERRRRRSPPQHPRAEHRLPRPPTRDELRRAHRSGPSPRKGLGKLDDVGGNTDRRGRGRGSGVVDHVVDRPGAQVHRHQVVHLHARP